MMQILFEMEAKGQFDRETIETLCEERISPAERERARSILAYTAENIDSIDETINGCSKSWKTTRMPKVDLAILRLAVGEERSAGDVTDAVVVSEALNMTKKFSTDQSSSFVHGVLGAIFQR